MSVVRSPERDSSLGPDLSFLNGAVITQVFLHEHAAGLVFESDHGVYEWYVEEPLLLRSGGSTSHLNPKVPISMAPLLSLLRRTVERDRAGVPAASHARGLAAHRPPGVSPRLHARQRPRPVDRKVRPSDP